MPTRESNPRPPICAAPHWHASIITAAIRPCAPFIGAELFPPKAKHIVATAHLRSPILVMFVRTRAGAGGRAVRQWEARSVIRQVTGQAASPHRWAAGRTHHDGDRVPWACASRRDGSGDEFVVPLWQFAHKPLLCVGESRWHIAWYFGTLVQ